MKLRLLQEKDAPFMLEWMHDPNVVEFLRADFASKTVEDCALFIKNAQNTSENLHLAIANEDDEYMGTVSLKNVKDATAEFAITIRSCAMGKGYSQYGMQSIIEIGLKELGLKEIYWCVMPENHRAIRFYNKLGYQQCRKPSYHTEYSNDETVYTWYHILCDKY